MLMIRRLIRVFQCPGMREALTVCSHLTVFQETIPGRASETVKFPTARSGELHRACGGELPRRTLK